MIDTDFPSIALARIGIFYLYYSKPVPSSTDVKLCTFNQLPIVTLNQRICTTNNISLSVPTDGSYNINCY